MLGGKNSVQDPLLLKLTFLTLEQYLHLSQSNIRYIVTFILSPSKFPKCACITLESGYLVMIRIAFSIYLDISWGYIK